MSSSTALDHAHPAVLAVLFFPDGEAGPPARAPARLKRVERYKRNSRTPEYMRELARASLGPGCELVEVPTGRDPAEVLTAERLRAAEEIVLLWPDAIGHGWWAVERTVFAGRRPPARVSVLTGRRRRFPATPRALVPFRVRRAVERMWIGEIALTAALLAPAPLLVAWDALRGRTRGGGSGSGRTGA